MHSSRNRASTCRLAVLALFILLSSCVSVQESAFPIGSKSWPAKPSSAVVEVYRDAPPSRPYEAVARLNVHIEKTFFIKSAYSEALPRLQSLAREKGADAIIQISEDRSQLNETYIYNVKAVAIVYTD